MVDKVADLVPRSGTDTLMDRRRFGRVDYQNPHLIDLLRAPSDAPQPAEPVEEPFDDEADAHPLAPARGIMRGMLIASGMWAAGGLLVWWVF